MTQPDITEHVFLIACSKQKLAEPAPARLLYQGSLFKKSLGYAQQTGATKILILSAKYGVVGLDDLIVPYEMTLNGMRAQEIQQWSCDVVEQLSTVTDLINDQFTILAGRRYHERLLPHIRNAEIPLKGKGIGNQLKWLTERLRHEQ